MRHVAAPAQTGRTCSTLSIYEVCRPTSADLLRRDAAPARIAITLVAPRRSLLRRATTGLDPKSLPTCADHRRRWNGTTVFLTTQYLEEADGLADEIAILHGGRIVASGTPDELKAMVPTGIVELEFSEEGQLFAAQRALGEQHEVGRVDSKLVVATTGSVAERPTCSPLKTAGSTDGFSPPLPR